MTYWSRTYTMYYATVRTYPHGDRSSPDFLQAGITASSVLGLVRHLARDPHIHEVIAIWEEVREY